MPDAKSKLKTGQKVAAKRLHAKSVDLTGTIVKIHEGTDDCVDIKLENGTVETVHAPDCTVIEEKK